MDMVTDGQAARIAERTARIVATWRANADEMERRGRTDDARAMRALADSRERAGSLARVGARIGRA